MMDAAATRIRVLVVDDHPVVRYGLLVCLAERPPFQVVGEAGDGEEAMRQARLLKPDLMLVDVELPLMDGLQVTEAVRRELAEVRVVIFTVHAQPEFVQRAMKAGARAYVLKNAAPDTLVSVLGRVHRGEVLLPPEVAQSRLRQCASAGGGAVDLKRVTQEEKEILAAVANGGSSREIARGLGLSVRTVQGRRERLMRALGMHGAAALTKFAVAQGLVPLLVSAEMCGGIGKPTVFGRAAVLEYD